MQINRAPKQKSYLGVWIFLLVLVIVGSIVGGLVFFGGSTEEPAPAETEAVPEVVVPVKTYKYKQPSTDPAFGTYFSYKNSLQGNIPQLPFSQNVRTGILVDLNTRKVIWDKNSRDGVPIASMVKMMTMLLAFETLEANEGLTLEAPVQVSVASTKIGGSQVYLDPRETFPLGELLKAVAIKSANDAAYLSAEYVSGKNVPLFVHNMNIRARQLRMPNTKFVNPHGLPNANKENSLSSAEGMAILAERLLEYPKFLEWSSTVSADFREKGSKGWQHITSTNKRLLTSCAGVDGMKTGYIAKSGFCLTASCLRNGRRLIAVVTGCPSPKERDKFVGQLLDWGYNRIYAEEAKASANSPTVLPMSPTTTSANTTSSK